MGMVAALLIGWALCSVGTALVFAWCASASQKRSRFRAVWTLDEVARTQGRRS
jgi:apolipoprotein N-acyltransferase